MEQVTFTTEMLAVLGLLALAVFLFVSEIVRVDVAAICIMTLLGMATIVPGLEGIIDTQDLFMGFSSNAVISIIAIMIIGAGLDRTGVVGRIANLILRYGGNTERRVIPLVSVAVGGLSSFMQNVGAAALFIPIVSRISARSGIHLSRLLMPMGFCAILGGTMTMVGSSPLILLNDLLETSNQSLPIALRMEPFNLFSVTPIGLALIVTGIVYFTFAGRFVLPDTQAVSASATSTMAYYTRTYGLDYRLYECVVPASSALVGKTVRDVERGHRIRVIGTRLGSELHIEPWGGREISAGMQMAVFIAPEDVERITETNDIVLSPKMSVFADSLTPLKAGICEVVIPPNSRLIEQTIRDVNIRDRYGLSVIGIHRAGTTLRQGVRDTTLQAGDTLVCHSTWQNLFKLRKDRDFVVITTEFPHDESRPEKVAPALVFFTLAIGLVLFSELRLSTALLTGAVGMVLSGVLSMDEAYQAVSWKTVFLLASLIPLGQAMEVTGTATWISQQMLYLLGGAPVWVIQAVLAVLATLFTLVMSNVGATVLLVPLAISIAVGAGANPAMFALTVAIATSNSFLIPTHQVNALIMGPGGYKVSDFIRAGGIMTILFLIVSLVGLNLLF